MGDTARCAVCGETHDLCDSVRIDGVKQPRLCKDCLLKQMAAGDCEINTQHWIMQMVELNDTESLAALKKEDS